LPFEEGAAVRSGDVRNWFVLYLGTTGLGNKSPANVFKVKYRSESLRMKFHLEKLAVAAAVAIVGMRAAHAQSAVEQLQPLVETTAHRLMIGEQVALAEWDSGKAVEEAPRESQVILGAIENGVAKGLDEAAVSNFFTAQIEANKFVQYAVLGDRNRAGKAPEHAPVDLLKVIRPQLDEMQKSLIAELVDTAAVRKSKTCHADVAKAVGK
jgi:chorismate mutase